MSLSTDLTALKNKENTLSSNKVCNFAYDDTAYDDDTSTGADGVEIYNYNNHNNIPVADYTILKVNPTILSKGFRSQVSTLPRMLLNHIFGRVSYNLNKTVDVVNAMLTTLLSYLGTANGLATLDSTGRLPYSQLALSAVEYKGAWNANTNTPTLSAGTGTYGDEYIVSTAGTQDLGEGSIAYAIGDRVIYNGSIWQRISSGSVRTVNGKDPDLTGNVEITAEDVDTPDIYMYDKTTLGKTWTKITTSGFTAEFVYYANGLWQACTSSGLWWSTDGKTWTHGTGANTSYAFNTVFYSDGIWIAGSDGYGLWKSTDGKAWVQVTGSTVNYAFYSVTGFNGLWIAGSSSHGVWWSADGSTWTQGTGFDSTVSCKTVHYANGVWLATYDPAITTVFGLYWSLDGKAWTRATAGSVAVLIKSIFASNGMWVAVTDKGLWWSTDGQTWTQSTGTTTSYTFYSVYYANGIWVAGSSNHGLWWSTDGKNWTQVTGGTTSYRFNAVCYANGTWVAGSSSHGLWWSTDGQTWTQVTGDTAGDSFLNNIYANNKMFIASPNTYYRLCYSEATRTNNVADILDTLIAYVDSQ
jgi:hypothetical protein